jgi:hypothetical protein
MHILLGALIGAVLGAVGAVIVAKAMGRPVTWKAVAAGALGGAVGGAITAATLGVGGAAAATAAEEVAAYTVGGAAGGAATQATDNVLEGRPVGQGVAEATVLGAATGPLAYGVGRVVAPVAAKVAPQVSAILARLSTPAEVAAAPELTAAAEPAAATLRPPGLGPRPPPAPSAQPGMAQAIDPEMPLGTGAVGAPAETAAVPATPGTAATAPPSNPAPGALGQSPAAAAGLGVPAQAPNGNLIVWRAVSDAELADIQRTGGLSLKNGVGESFVSSSRDYVQQLAARQPNLYPHLLQIELAPDALSQLEQIGVRAPSSQLAAAYPNMPPVAKGMVDAVHFKAELGTLNLGLRSGSVKTFNGLVKSVTEVSQ